MLVFVNIFAGVRFGQATPEVPLSNATAQSKLADCALVLGI